MNQAVQIVLLLALLPMIGSAREETLEERKQRITRKYMREHSEIAQSDLLVPSELVEDERVSDSEGFNELPVEFLRQESGSMPAPPPPEARSRPRRTNRNWLLDDSDSELEEDSDPYADPYADLYADPYGDPYADSEQSENAKTEDSWSSWGKDQRENEQDAARRDSSRDPRDSWGRQEFYSGEEEQGSQSGYSFKKQGGLFGGGDRSGSRSYGASPDSGLLYTPFSKQETKESSSFQREKKDNIPYQSPHQQKQQLQREQQRSWSSQQQQQDYGKPSVYQQWKSKNKAFDPSKEDRR